MDELIDLSGGHMLIDELEPVEVFKYFKEISDIPRGSGNTEKIASYCEEFARRNSLKAVRDKADNVIIFKAASKGYEEHEPVILQGHLDMVCEKAADCDIDMEHEGVRLCTDGNSVWADGTTLGADDGIAVAYILAVLASDVIQHPPIQAVFTADEEIGMLGAQALDTGVLTAKRLINIDSETEGILFVSCAGGVRARCDIPVEYTFLGQEDRADNINNQALYEISISGLAGGHSGIEIHKQHANAIRLIASTLEMISRHFDIRIADISGGGKENAIPKEAKAVIYADSGKEAELTERIKEYELLVRKDMRGIETGAVINICKINDVQTSALNMCRCLTKKSTADVIYALQMSPDGVYKVNPEIDGMVQTSLNLGTAYIRDNMLTYKYLIRSNTASGKQLLLERVTAFVEYISGKVTTMSDYPAWEYKKDSRLRQIMVESFSRIYGHEPEVTSVHAGLECGILSGKMPDVDMISFGPTLTDVHTPDERMDVASVKRSWDYLLEALKNM